MTSTAIRTYADIKGWFFDPDRTLFDVILSAQEATGTLVELGAYLGRSAVVVGDHVRIGERFVVIDLFGSEDQLTDSEPDAANRAENRYSYSTLTRAEFENNYLALHPALPEVVQAPSSAVLQHVEPGTARFVHVDASHLYTQVAEDVLNTRTILQPDGVVVFDDHSNPNTPGVAGAVWEAVAVHGLIPFAVTRYKMYGTWGDPTKYLELVRGRVAGDERIACAEQEVMGHTVLRIGLREQPKPATPPKTVAPKTVAPKLDAESLDAIAAGVARRLYPAPKRSDWVPPVVARAIRRHRRG